MLSALVFELGQIFFEKSLKINLTQQIFRSIVLSGNQEQSVSELKTINISSIGDTTKKTINRTLAIGAAFTAAVILAPATFAQGPHGGPPPRPSNGIQLAADIIKLVRAVIEPRPAPVIVKPEPAVVEKTVVVEKPVVVASTQQVVTATPGTVIVTGAEEAGIPEYSYILYGEEYIPYYDGWLFYHDEWHWGRTEPRPFAPPKWTPPPRHRDDRPHKVIVLPASRRDHAPLPLIRHEEPRHAPAPVIRHDAPRREPVRTVVVRPEKKDAARAEPQKNGAPPAKKR